MFPTSPAAPFRIVTCESRREKNVTSAENPQRDPRRVKYSVIAIKKDFKHLPEGSLADKSASHFKNDIRPLISSKENQKISCIREINGHTVGPKDDSFFSEEAKRHLSEMLKDKDGSISYPTVQFRESLEGILCLPHRNVSTPGDSPKGSPDFSPEECKVEREECRQERSPSPDGLESIACSASAALVDRVTVQEGYFINEAQEGSKLIMDEPGAMHIEGIDKSDFCKRIDNTECILAKQIRDNAEQGILEEMKEEKKPVKMPSNSAKNIVKQLEQQDPETPEPRASTKLISYGSPEQSKEKKEKASPVSVLESLFEDIRSPDCINKKEYELSEDLRRALYFGDDVSDVKVIWENKHAKSDYIKLVLELSELCA